jgi:hypothetical protein
MRKIGMRAWVALAAGLLALAGGRTLAQGYGGTGTGTGSSGSTTSSSPGTAASTTTHGDQIVGRVDRIDRSTNTMSLNGKMLKLDSSTEVTKDGARASLNDIQEGDQVRASYAGSGDTLNVQRVDVLSSGSAGSRDSSSTSGSTGSTNPSTSGTQSK